MKEFDIFLNKRLTECDIIVYNIPYRDGLTAFNRIVLDCCLNSYLLNKFIAVKAGSELVAHIDEMIETVYEKLNYGVGICAETEVSPHYAISVDKSSVVLKNDDIGLLATVAERATNQLILAAQPLNAMIAKSLGSGTSSIVFSQEIGNILKYCVERVESGVSADVNVEQTHKQGFERAISGVGINPEMVDLLYRFETSGEAAITLAAAVLATEIHFSFGYASSGIEFATQLSEDGDCATKFIDVYDAISILGKLTESIVQFMSPEKHGVVQSQLVSAITKRYRLLNDLDQGMIQAMDNMTFAELDYVILAE